MDDEELVRRLKERGYRIGNRVIREDGVMLWLINAVFMFRLDAVDLADGVAGLEDVILRNAGKVFPKAPPTEYERFQARVFQEMKDMEDAHKRQVVEDLVAAAKARGLSIDDLLRLLDSVGVEGIFRVLNG